MVEWVVQEEINKKVRRKPCSLKIVSDVFKTQKICIKALELDPWSFKYVPDNLKTWGVFEKAVDIEPWLLVYVPDNLKTKRMQEICDKVRRGVAFSICGLSLICLRHKNKYKYGMIITGLLGGGTIICLLNGMKVIKNRKLKKQT